MYELIVLRADYEGWWLFDDWREKIIDKQQFNDSARLKECYDYKLIEMRKHFNNEVIGKFNIHAFYSNCEIEYCEDCDEDIQIYYSLIALKEDEILQIG